MPIRNFCAALSASTSLRSATVLIAMSAGLLVAPAAAQSLPAVSNAGGSTINTAGNTMTVNLNGASRIIAYNSFDVPSGNTVNFIDGSAGAPAIGVLNRVTGGTFSQIDGAIVADSNVEVWLSNPNGIVFGGNGSFSGGSLVLTTLGVTDADFLDGGAFHLTGAGSSGVSLSAGSGGVDAAGSIVIAAPWASVGKSLFATGSIALVAANNVQFITGLGSPLAIQVNTGTTSSGLQVTGSASLRSGSVGLVASSGATAMNTLLAVDAGASLTATAANGRVILATADYSGPGASIALPENAFDAIVANGSLAASGGTANVSVNAAGNANVAAITAGGNVAISGNAVSAIGNVVAGGNYEIDALSSITAGSGAASVTQQAAGYIDFTADNGDITGGSGLTLRSNTDGAGGGGDNIWLIARTGNILGGMDLVAGTAAQRTDFKTRIGSLTNDIVVGDIFARDITGSYGASSESQTTMAQNIALGELDLANGIEFLATGTLSAGNIAVATGDVSLTAAASTLSSITSGAGNIALTGPITLSADAVFTGTNVTVNDELNAATSGGTSLTVNASGTATFNAGMGGVSLLSNLAVNSGAGTVFNNGTVAAAGEVRVTAGTDIAINNGADITAGQDLYLTAGNLIALGMTSTALSGRDLVLTADDWTGGIFSDSILLETRDLTLNDTAGGIYLSPSLSAQRNFTLNTQNGGGLTITGTLSSVGNAGMVTVTGSNLTIGATGQLLGRDVVASSATTFTNESGSDAIVATGGKWTVYAANPSTSTFDSLNSGNTAMWNGTLATKAPGTLTGNRYVFAYQPTLTVSSTDVSKVYGTDLTGTLNGNYSASGLHAGVTNAFLGDTLAGILSGTPSITSTGSTANADVAGSPYVMTVSQGTLAVANGYALSLSNAGELTVTPKGITASVAANDKAYDGGNAATASVSLTGLVAGDTVGTTSGTFAFADKNVGTNKTVTVSGVSLTGADAGNYTLTVPASVLADIVAKAITGTATAGGKTYDGTTAATGFVALSGVVAGDTVGTSGTTFAFADKNVGTGKTVNVSGTTLTGTDAGNYTLTVNATTLADIVAKAISGAATANGKTYDGTTVTTGSVTLNGVVAGDTVGTGGTSFAFTDKNVGTGKTVNVTGTGLTGADAGNYTLTVNATTLADIVAKAITASVAANDKTYDGTTAATGSVSLSGVIDGDAVGTNGAMFAFADKNAGADKTVTVSGTALTGADAGNYTLTVPASTLADIVAKAITGTATANGKTYDGTTAASGSVTLSGVVAGDTIGTSGTTFAFANKNAGNGRTVNVGGTALTGADASNYTLAVNATALADVLAKAITGSLIANNKTYDGTTAGTGSISLSDVIAGDTVGATGTFAFADKNAGAGKTVTVSGVSLTGADAGNYTLSVPASTLADIVARAIVISANDASKVEGQADPQLTFQVGGQGLAAGDSLSGALARESGEGLGDYAIQQGSLTAGSNYTVSYEEGTFSIVAQSEPPVPPADSEPGENKLRVLPLPSQVEVSVGIGTTTVASDALCAAGDENCVAAQ